MTYTRSKRSIDVALALIGLFALWPVLAAISLLIAVVMGRPVLFRQERPGLGSKNFELVKFRTMTPGEDSDRDRLTPLGRYLRSTSLDELPELWNIVRGEMSFVGPRPLLPDYLPLYSDRQARRHEVRPGLTGLAQVNGRNAASWEDRLELDVQYVERVSLKLDLAILRETVSVVLRREGISAQGSATNERFRGTTDSTAQERA